MGLLNYIADKLHSNGKEVALVESQLGIEQEWQDFTSTRVENTDYINDTGKPIMVNVYISKTVSSGAVSLVAISGSYTTGYAAVGSFDIGMITLLIPPGYTYQLNDSAGQLLSILTWYELREVV